MRPGIERAATVVWERMLDPKVTILGNREEQIQAIAEVIDEEIGFRIPENMIEIRESKDFDTGGWRFIATVRFAAATRLEQERLEDCPDVIAQAALIMKTRSRLAQELGEHPYSHHIGPGDVIPVVDILELLR